MTFWGSSMNAVYSPRMVVELNGKSLTTVSIDHFPVIELILYLGLIHLRKFQEGRGDRNAIFSSSNYGIYFSQN